MRFIRNPTPRDADHYGVTDVERDPSSRCPAASASAWRHCTFSSPTPRDLSRSTAFPQQLENGYAIRDFKGQELQKQVLDRFKQFPWRPRPRTSLTKEQPRQVRKTLRENTPECSRRKARRKKPTSAPKSSLTGNA